LSKRFNSHKRDCKCGKRAISLYSHIVDNDWTDWYIELYELYPCNNRTELNRKEGEVIREIGTINKCIAGRTKKEYREDNIEKIKKYCEDNSNKRNEMNKKWREENASKLKKYREKKADKIKENAKQYYKDKLKEKRQNEKVCCNICGAFSSKHNLAKHQKTKSCMSKIPNNTDIPTDTHI
jgi:rubrerythrin